MGPGPRVYKSECQSVVGSSFSANPTFTMPVTIVYLCEMPEVEVIEIDDQSASPEPDVVDLTTEEESLSPPMEWEVVQVTDSSNINEQNGNQLEMTDAEGFFYEPKKNFIGGLFDLHRYRPPQLNHHQAPSFVDHPKQSHSDPCHRVTVNFFGVEATGKSFVLHAYFL